MSRLAELDFHDRDGVIVARIAGELDLSNVHDIDDALAAAVGSEARGLVIDLSELTHLDSAGVRLLFDLRARLATARQALSVVVPPEALVRQVIDLVAVPATIPVHPDVDTAVAAMGEPR